MITDISSNDGCAVTPEQQADCCAREKTMAAPASIDAIEWLRKQIEETAPDPLKAMLVEMVNLLMSAEVEAVWVNPGLSR